MNELVVGDKKVGSRVINKMSKWISYCVSTWVIE